MEYLSNNTPASHTCVHVPTLCDKSSQHKDYEHYDWLAIFGCIHTAYGAALIAGHGCCMRRSAVMFSQCSIPRPRWESPASGSVVLVSKGTIPGVRGLGGL